MQPVIKQGDNFAEVAKHIVNNLEKYRVDAQERTNIAIARLHAERKRKQEFEQGKLNRITESKEYDIAAAMGYGSNKTRTGD